MISQLSPKLPQKSERKNKHSELLTNPVQKQLISLDAVADPILIGTSLAADHSWQQWRKAAEQLRLFLWMNHFSSHFSLIWPRKPSSVTWISGLPWKQRRAQHGFAVSVGHQCAIWQTAGHWAAIKQCREHFTHLMHDITRPSAGVPYCPAGKHRLRLCRLFYFASDQTCFVLSIYDQYHIFKYFLKCSFPGLWDIMWKMRLQWCERSQGEMHIFFTVTLNHFFSTYRTG